MGKKLRKISSFWVVLLSCLDLHNEVSHCDYEALITSSSMITDLIPLHEKFLQFDWLRAVVFQLNLKYLHVKITKLLWVVV